MYVSEQIFGDTRDLEKHLLAPMLLPFASNADWGSEAGCLLPSLEPVAVVHVV